MMPTINTRAGLIALFAVAGFCLPAVASAGPWGKLVSPDGKQVFALKKSSVVVGTHRRADVRLKHPTVAKKHVRITHKDGVVMVTDLGSRSGTLVAGTALTKGKSMQLFQRTMLSLGAKSIFFEWGDRGKLIKPLRGADGKVVKGAAKAKKRKKRRRRRRRRK